MRHKWSILQVTDKPFNRDKPLALLPIEPTLYERAHSKYPIDLRMAGPNSRVRIIRRAQRKPQNDKKESG